MIARPAWSGLSMRPPIGLYPMRQIRSVREDTGCGLRLFAVILRRRIGRSGQRTCRAGLYPGLDQRAGLCLRTGRGGAAETGVPGPADQRVRTDMMDQVFDLAAAVTRGILELRADFSQRLALPCHLPRGELPYRVTRHAAGIEVRGLMTNRAVHGLDAMAV